MTLHRAAVAAFVVVGAALLLMRSAEPQRDLRPPPTASVGAVSETAVPSQGDPTELPGGSGTGGQAADGPAGVPEGARPAIVASITDGDTLRVETGTGNQAVRLLELDTPEVTGDCGASEATHALTTLAPVGSPLWLEADVEDRDRYGRLLRYLWRDDGSMINETLVRLGWARATLYPPNDRYWPLMLKAEQDARADNAGLWSLCAWNPAPRSASSPIRSAPPGSVACDPNYSGCVPPYPPDVDCGQVDGPVAVIGVDAHHLDGDGDGQGCEPAPG